MELLELLQWAHLMAYQEALNLLLQEHQIQVPVGEGTLGRIMDVLGRPIDEVGKIDSKEFRSIHQKAPEFNDLSAIN